MEFDKLVKMILEGEENLDSVLNQINNQPSNVNSSEKIEMIKKTNDKVKSMSFQEKELALRKLFKKYPELEKIKNDPDFLGVIKVEDLESIEEPETIEDLKKSVDPLTQKSIHSVIHDKQE